MWADFQSHLSVLEKKIREELLFLIFLMAMTCNESQVLSKSIRNYEYLSKYLAMLDFSVS